jgi:3-oxoadipate enol-lactonase
MMVQTPRGRLAVRRTGSGGKPVLLLHPLALSGEVWQPMASYLAQDRAIVAADARGHGDSDWDGADFTIDDLAADAAAIIETLGGQPVDVVGLSMGGSTAIVLAASRPELVGRLVLADTTACYGPDRAETWAKRAERAEKLPRDKQLEFQRDRWFTDRFRAHHPDEVRRVAGIFVRTDSKAHGAACRAFGAMDSTGRLGDIRAETLVLVGDEDYATPPAMAVRIAEGVPSSRLRILKKTRHLSLVERRDLWPSIAEHLHTRANYRS